MSKKLLLPSLELFRKMLPKLLGVLWGLTHNTIKIIAVINCVGISHVSVIVEEAQLPSPFNPFPQQNRHTFFLCSLLTFPRGVR